MKIFTTEFLSKVILEAIILGMIVFAIQKYFDHRLQPLTAAETLKKENFLNSKRDVYFTALNLINRYLANASWTGANVPDKKYGVNVGDSMPTETEVNTCFAKLCIYTEDKNILTAFIDFFDKRRTTKPTTQLLAEFTNLLRQDLGYNISLLNSTKDEYRYIRITKSPIDSSFFEQ